MHRDRLAGIVSELARRPGHEKVRTHLFVLLSEGLGAKVPDILQEVGLCEMRGRIDTLFGNTLFEIKSDLRREGREAEHQLARYLKDRQEATGHEYVGIATDGAQWRAYVLRDGAAACFATAKADPKSPERLLWWLEAFVRHEAELPAEPERIRETLGPESPLYHYALGELQALWERLHERPHVALQHDLWRRLVAQVYGSDVEEAAPELFFQHTYLTVVAKAVATAAFFERRELPTMEARDLLSGRRFFELGVHGVVESDFFDWFLEAGEGAGDRLVHEILAQIARIRFETVEVDLLKVLYESLIDPRTRHDLGEYYTPDWLARRICERAIEAPLSQRVLDPACGSGTFLFHAVRLLLARAREQGMPAEEQVRAAVDRVVGIDIHPVAVIFARVTYLLALLPALREGRPARFAVPVFLGDSLQWAVRQLFGKEDIEILVPRPGIDTLAEIETEPPSSAITDADILKFTRSLVDDPEAFERLVSTMLDLARQKVPVETALGSFRVELGRIPPEDLDVLERTYRTLVKLIEEGRNHIWGYVARNLARPVWLAGEARQADVIVGNPPWLRYSAMSGPMQRRFREEAERVGLWVGRKSATAMDLSAYFLARAIELYLKEGGRLAFVMPYAALSRAPYARLREGNLELRGRQAALAFEEAWGLADDVKPLFPVPSCVLFVRFAEQAVPLARLGVMRRFSGELPRRNATAEEAARALVESIEPLPPDVDGEPLSPYGKAFRQGATLVPRRFVLVEELPAGRLGPNPHVARVRGRAGAQDKMPWKAVDPPEGSVERVFLRPVILGESIAPFRVFRPFLGVVPVDPGTHDILDSERALRRGYRNLAAWLSTVEALWEKHRANQNMEFEKWLDYMHKLSDQFPIPSKRLVYTKSGTNLVAAVFSDEEAIIDHTLYWMRGSSENEMFYLAGILNSETARRNTEQLQSRGQFGARHFDTYVWHLPIPRFAPREGLHRQIAELARRATDIAASVEIGEDEHFQRVRRRIRAALVEAGIMRELDAAVRELLETGRRTLLPPLPGRT